MERVKGFFSDNIVYIGTGVVVVATSAYIYKKLFPARIVPSRKCGVDYPRDTVIVHQSFQCNCIPSLGHFVIKLETYLRMAKIPNQPYHDDYRTEKGPKEKIPWIEYNGQVMGDSQLIINFLNKELNVDLNKHLNPTQRALAWAVQKWVEEFTYWLNVYTRWYTYVDGMFEEVFDGPKMFKNMVKKKMATICHTVGVGRHTPEEVAEFMKNDLRQLSLILGDQQFMFGDQPAEVDCAVFGILAQVRWATPDACPGKQLLISELKNLMAYTDRIQAAYWSDWTDRLKKSYGEQSAGRFTT